MKKTMIFVSAIVVMAMSAMFVACSSENAPANGCACTVSYQGEVGTENISLAEMQREGYKNCSEVAADIRAFSAESGMAGASVTCKGY